MRTNPRRRIKHSPLMILAVFCVTVIPVLALTVCSALYVRHLGRYLSPRLAPLVAQAAADALHREVQISRIQVFDRPGVIVIEDVAVSNGRTFVSGHGLSVARIPEAVITYDLPRLLRNPADAEATIQTVELTHPSLYAEQFAPGKFNFSPLIKPPNPAKPFPFQGKIIVHDGTLTVRDNTAPKILGIQQNHFTHASGSADLTMPGRVAFQVTAHGATNRFASMILHGDVLDPSLRAPATAVRGFSLRVQVTQGNVPYLTDYFAPFLIKTFRIGGGVGNADVTVAQFGTIRPGPMTVLGNAFVRNGTVSLADRSILLRPLEAVTTHLAFTTTDLAVDGTTAVSGVPLSVHGAILDFAHPHLALSIDSTAVTYPGLKSALTFIPALPSGITIPDQATATTWVTGDLRHPRVEISATLPAVIYSGTTLTDVRAKADFQNGLLRIERVQADEPTTQGAVDLSGYVGTRAMPLVYGITGTAVNVSLSGLPLSAGLKRQIGPLQGRASAKFQASSAGLQADVAITGANIRHIAFDDLTGSVNWTPGRAVVLRRLVAHVANGGVIYADGLLPFGGVGPGRWDLSVQAAQVNLGRLTHAFVNLPVGGELYLFGRLQGSGEIPELTGKLTVLVPHYGDFVADQLKGAFSATSDGVQLEKVVIQRFPATAVIAGSVTHFASSSPVLNLHVTVTGAQLSDVTRLSAQHPVAASAARAIAASSPTLTGDVAADLGVSGTFSKPQVAGQVTLSDATYSIFELDHALADVAYSADTLHITRLTASGTGLAFQGTGSYGLHTHRIAAQIAASVDDIGRLLPASIKTLAIAGPASATIAVGGTTESPSASAEILGQKILVAGIAFDNVSLATRYDRGVFSSAQTGLTLVSGSARYQVPDFRYDLRTTQFSLSGLVGGESIRHLLMLARKLRIPPGSGLASFPTYLATVPPNADGQITLSLVQASGSLKSPEAHIVLNAKNIVYGTERLDTIDTDVRYAQGAFDIASLEARGKPNAYVSAAGHIDPAGPIDAHFEASGIDLAPLNSFLSLKKPIGGQISDVTIVASGSARAPTLAASVTLERPSYGSFFVDGLDSGQIAVGNNQITVNGLQIVKDEKTTSGQIIEHFASLRGSVPFAWKSGSILTPTFPRTVPLSLQVTLPPQNLSSIPALFPGVPLRFPTGTISADLALGGTLADKQISGSLIIANGSVQSKLLTTQLRDVNVNVSLVGTQAQITMAAASTAGGSVRITGGASLTTGMANTSELATEIISGVRLNLTATAAGFLVNEPKITQFGNAGFRGKVDGTVTVTQSLRNPLVAGNMILSSVIGVLPSLAETAGAPAPIPLVDPRFQLGIAVARGSRLRSSLLDAQTDGALAVQGTLSAPNIIGDFTIRQGQFFFPTATFRVVPVGTVHLAYSPPNDPVERVNLTARTQISVSDATIAANPSGAGIGSGSYLGSNPYAGAKFNPAAQTSRNYTITVTIQGLLNSTNNLNLDFQSDPPGLTQSQILATLGGQQTLSALTQGNAEQGLKTGISQVFTSFAVPLALQPVEKGIANGLGLEDFSVAFSPDAPVQLTFVKRLTPRIGLTYMQMVNSRSTGAVANTLEPPIFQIKLDYSFTDRFRFTVSTDDQRNTIVGLERVYSF